MSMLVEGELMFDFSASVNASKFDEQGKQLPIGMSFVDFVVEEDNRLLMVEVKDPSASAADHIGATRAMMGVEFINDRLVPKARDSYTVLHLMRLDVKPMVYIVFLGLEHVVFDPAMLIVITDRLRKRLAQEMDVPWKRQYVSHAMVVNMAEWNKHFANYPVTRS
jgi:hypothetical protein